MPPSPLAPPAGPTPVRPAPPPLPPPGDPPPGDPPPGDPPPGAAAALPAPKKEFEKVVADTLYGDGASSGNVVGSATKVPSSSESLNITTSNGLDIPASVRLASVNVNVISHPAAHEPLTSVRSTTSPTKVMAPPFDVGELTDVGVTIDVPPVGNVSVIDMSEEI